MSRTDRGVDAVVVGGGPSGLFAALELARSGARTLLLEKGGTFAESLCPKVRAQMASLKLRDAERFRMQCPRCDCLTGLGGAAFHFDTTLGYFRSLTRSKVERAADGSVQRFSGLERALGSFQLAESLIREVYEICFALGLPREYTPEHPEALEGSGAFTHVDTAASQPVTVQAALELIDAIAAELAARGAGPLTGTEVTELQPGRERRWRVRARTPHGEQAWETDAVVLAAGKQALPWVVRLLRALGVEHRPAAKVDLGVRLETLRDDMRPIVAACHNPKLSFLNPRGESVRTFCVCDGGRLMQYQVAGVTVLDGQHCIDRPTSRTNFGVLTTVSVPEGTDGTEAALEFARRVNALGGGRPVVQRLGDLVAMDEGGGGPELESTLIDHTRADLRDCLPPGMVDDLAGMVARLNEVAPGCVRPYALVTAPVAERIYPSVELSPRMETSLPGLYMVGDCSSRIIGITYGAATGLVAARAITGSPAAREVAA